MLRAYRWSRDGALFGTGGAFFFAMFLLPPCGCGFAMMPAWQAAAILLCWLGIVIIVGVSTVVALCAGAVLWLRYGVRCPAMALALACCLLVLGFSLPLLG
jgi:hypothetical protein